MPKEFRVSHGIQGEKGWVRPNIKSIRAIQKKLLSKVNEETKKAVSSICSNYKELGGAST
jgi:dihydroxyacetone kinase